MTPVMVTLVSKFPREGYTFRYIVVQKSTNSMEKMYFFKRQNHQKLCNILENKEFQKLKLSQNCSKQQKCFTKIIFLMKIMFRKIQLFLTLKSDFESQILHYLTACHYIFLFKVHIFWEGHKILRNLPLTFDRMYCSQKLGEDFAKFLWPSQNIWTLLSLTSGPQKFSKISVSKVNNFVLLIFLLPSQNIWTLTS